MSTKTTFDGVDSSERNWHLVDASGLPVGRLASEIAQILRGKHNLATIMWRIDNFIGIIIVSRHSKPITIVISSLIFVTF